MFLEAWINYWDLPDPMRWAIGLWLFAFGACAGSFMNVVIWRMPLGRSIVYPGSRCPNCGHSVRSYDNIPILNWLVLRGRCRDCGIGISWRYPAVETLVAVLFVLVALAEPLREGRNLPRFPEASSYNMSGLILLWVFYFEQMFLLCTLLCAAFMWFDGHRPPERLFAPLAVVALFAPLISPELRPEQWVDRWIQLSPRVSVAIESMLGLLFAAAVAGITTATVYPRRANFKWSFTPAMCELSVCTLVFGIPGTARIVAVASLLAAVLAFVAKCTRCRNGASSEWVAGVAAERTPQEHALGGLPLVNPSQSNQLEGVARFSAIVSLVPWTALLAASAVLHIAFWKVTANWLQAALHGRQWLVVPAAVAIVAVLSGIAKILRRELPGYASGWNRDWPIQRQGVAMPKRELSASVEAIVTSPSYKLAELDTDFLQRNELRPVRMQLELLKPEMTLVANAVRSTIVVFGGTQVIERAAAEKRLDDARAALAAAPGDLHWTRQVTRFERLLAKASYYDAAREFARIVSSSSQTDGQREYVIVTGGGPGIMEAANRGAHDVAAKSVGLNITLPEEQLPNAFITPELCFQFHYFALRKMHFVLRAKALVVFPGGFGTLDELFEVLTLRQTNRMQAIPVILFGRDYWSRVLDFQFLADEGVIADEHLQLIEYAEMPQQAWEIICQFHNASGDRIV